MDVILKNELSIHSGDIGMHVYMYVKNSKLHQDSDSINGQEPEWTVQVWLQYY